MGGLVRARTLATHLFFGVGRLWRASFIVDGSWIRIGGRRHRIAVRMRIVGVLPLMHRTQGLAVRTINGRWWPLLGIKRSSTPLRRHPPAVPQMRIGRVRGHKGLRLRRDRREDAFLLETLTVGATTIVRCFEARAPDLLLMSTHPSLATDRSTYFASPAISTRDRRALPRGRLIVTHVLLWSTPMRVLRMSGIHVVLRMSI